MDLRGAEGEVEPDTRYLGGRFSYNSTNRTEVQQRIREATAAFNMIGGFGALPGFRWFKRLVYTARVLSALASACVAYVFLASEVSALQAVVCKHLRMFLRGRAFLSRMSNQDVLRYWRVPLVSVIFAERRVRY